MPCRSSSSPLSRSWPTASVGSISREPSWAKLRTPRSARPLSRTTMMRSSTPDIPRSSFAAFAIAAQVSAPSVRGGVTSAAFSRLVLRLTTDSLPARVPPSLSSRSSLSDSTAGAPSPVTTATRPLHIARSTTGLSASVTAGAGLPSWLPVTTTRAVVPASAGLLGSEPQPAAVSAKTAARQQAMILMMVFILVFPSRSAEPIRKWRGVCSATR